MRYTINSPMVIADKMDGEYIILNLETGKYFSALNTGAIAWELLVNGFTIIEAVEFLAAHFAISIEQVTKDLNDLLAKILENKLVKSTENKSKILPDLSLSETYKTPQITTYTDMEGLLLLDPIHEVENMGWPEQKKE